MTRSQATEDKAGPGVTAPDWSHDPTDSLPVGGTVSTALTSTSTAPKHLTEIVVIPRLLHGKQRRCGVDVSIMDTNDPPYERAGAAPPRGGMPADNMRPDHKGSEECVRT